jgi:hypothetical protein
LVRNPNLNRRKICHAVTNPNTLISKNAKQITSPKDTKRKAYQLRKLNAVLGLL